MEVSLIKTEKASFAVGKSERSLAKCSIVEMTVSNVGWFAESNQYFTLKKHHEQ